MSSEYEYLIDVMNFSFSRLSAYHKCPYMWRMKYIYEEEGESNALAEYGKFVHSLLEKFAKGEVEAVDLPMMYAEGFDDAITYEFPFHMKESRYEGGLDYMYNVKPLTDKYEVLGVEKKINTEIAGHKIIGYIDLLLREKETGRIIIVDHKSSSIKFKKDGNVTKKDANHFDEFKKQMYMYSKAVIEEYGRVDELRWNMFVDGSTISIPFDEVEYEETLKWVEDTINQIKSEFLWFPNEDYFRCNNLCDYRFDCEYVNE